MMFLQKQRSCFYRNNPPLIQHSTNKDGQSTQNWQPDAIISIKNEQCLELKNQTILHIVGVRTAWITSDTTIEHKLISQLHNIQAVHVVI